MAYLNARGAPRDRHREPPPPPRGWPPPPADGRMVPVSVPPGRENGVGDPAAGDPFLDPRRGRDLLPAEGARRDQGQGNRPPVLRVPPEHPLRSLHVGYQIGRASCRERV